MPLHNACISCFVVWPVLPVNACVAGPLLQARGGRQDVGRDTGLTAFRNVMFESLETRRNEGLFFRVSALQDVPRGVPQLGLRERVLSEARL